MPKFFVSSLTFTYYCPCPVCQCLDCPFYVFHVWVILAIEVLACVRFLPVDSCLNGPVLMLLTILKIA